MNFCYSVLNLRGGFDDQPEIGIHFYFPMTFPAYFPIFSNADRSDGPGDTCREVIIPLGEATCSQSSAKER
jgi:hypothetical protein